MFAKIELDQLVDDLLTQAKFETSPVALLGALVLAARALPLEVVQALLPAYIERENAEIASSRDK